MLGNYLKKRRATEALAAAMARKDLADMQFAISQGADLAKVKDVFDEPGQHFQMSYAVQGALELAIEHSLPLEAFEMLMDAGAPVPTKFGQRPDPESLFNHDKLHNWPLGAQALSIIKTSLQRRDINTHTPQVDDRPSAAPRPRI